ncbi:9947_t:CDS:10 [Diversispora eburnea]|uniref:9947_t:CDS:1 n=1 Tax=Diversispora eburnea TaxID=1213867 RepID=A0A9N8YU12_9GLOM|nr:9947_t:CDS:10 [Diversispora eburnea]
MSSQFEPSTKESSITSNGDLYEPESESPSEEYSSLRSSTDSDNVNKNTKRTKVKRIEQVDPLKMDFTVKEVEELAEVIEEEKPVVQNETYEINYEQDLLFKTLHILKSNPQTERSYKSLIKDVNEHPELLPKRYNYDGGWVLQSGDEMMTLTECSRSYMADLIPPGVRNSNSIYDDCSLAPRRNVTSHDKPVLTTIVQEICGHKKRSLDIVYKNFRKLITLEGCHTSSTYSVLFDHSGERIFTANEDNKIKDSVPTSILFSPTPIAENKYIIATCKSANLYVAKHERDPIKFHNAITIKDKQLIAKRRTKLISSSFNYTGTKFAIGGNDGVIRIFTTMGDETHFGGSTDEDYLASYTEDKVLQQQIRDELYKFDLTEYLKAYKDPIPKSKPKRKNIKSKRNKSNADLSSISSDNGLETLNAPVQQEKVHLSRSMKSRLCRLFRSQRKEGENYDSDFEFDKNHDATKRETALTKMDDDDYMDVDADCPNPNIPHRKSDYLIELGDDEDIPNPFDPRDWLGDGEDNNQASFDSRDWIGNGECNDKQVDMNIDQDITKPLDNYYMNVDQESSDLGDPQEIRGFYEFGENIDVTKQTEINFGLAPSCENYPSDLEDGSVTHNNNLNHNYSSNNKNRTTPDTGQIALENEILKLTEEGETDYDSCSPTEIIIDKGEKRTSNRKEVNGLKSTILDIAKQRFFLPIHIADLAGHNNKVHSLEFAHNGDRLISGSDDGKVILWEYEINEKTWISKVLINGEALTTIKWSCDDNYVISGHANGEIYVFESASGEIVRHYKAHNGKFYVLEAHPCDSRLFMSAGYDDRIVLWDVGNKIELKSWNHTDLNIESDNALYNNDGGNMVFEYYDGKWRNNGSMFAVTDNGGKCHLIGVQTETYSRQKIREKYGQKFATEDQNAEVGIITSDSNPGVMIYNDAWVLGNCSSNQREVISWAGSTYSYQLDENFVEKISNPLPSEKIRSMDRRRLNVMIEEATKLKEGKIIRNRVEDLKEIRKLQRKLVLSEEEDEDEIDPLTTEIPIIPDDEERDQNYDPAFSSSDEDSSGRSEVESNSEVDSIIEDLENKNAVIVDDSSSEYAPTLRVKVRNKRKIPEESTPEPSIHDDEESAPFEELNNSHKSDVSSHYSGSIKGRPDRKAKRKRPNYNEEDMFSGIITPLDNNSEENRNSHISTYEISGSNNTQSTSLGANTRDTRGRRARRNKINKNIEIHEDNIEIDLDNRDYNSEEIREADTRPEWIKSVNPNFTYIPQPGDFFVYFKRGHKAFNTYISNNYENTELLSDVVGHLGDFPYCKKFDLSNVAFFQIDVVRWYENKRSKVSKNEYNEAIKRVEAKKKISVSIVNDYPDAVLDEINGKEKIPLYCIIQARVVEPKWRGSRYPPSPDFRRRPSKFLIPYVDLKGLREFIVPYEKFASGVNQNLQVGDKIQAYYMNGFYPGKIASRNDGALWSIPSFNIQWENSDGEDEFYPWELKRENAEDLPTSSMPEETRQKLFEIINELHSNEHYEVFAEDVEFHKVPDYLNRIQYPVSLGMIKSRLTNKFYRHPRGVEHDMEIIISNAKTFNEPGTFIPLTADKLDFAFRSGCAEQRIKFE